MPSSGTALFFKEGFRLNSRSKSNLWILIASIIGVIIIVSLIGSASSRITNVKMTVDNATVTLGDPALNTYSGTASFETGSKSVELKQFKFVSEDPSIAKIEGTEVKNRMVYFTIKAVNPGMTTVYIETAQGEKSNEMRISVDETDSYKFQKYVNEPLYRLRTYVSNLGFTATYLDEDTGEDITDNFETMDWSDLKDWVVVSVEDANDSERTATFRVDTKENLARKANQDKLNKELEKKLPYISAFQEVEKYGARVYPHGFKLHYMLGQQVAEALNENTWHLRATCTITHADGTEDKKDCDAEVTGTQKNMKVISFQIEDKTEE